MRRGRRRREESAGDCNILGPVELADGDQTVSLGATKEAHLLAALAVDVGRPVPMDVLVQRIWGDDPPGNPPASLYANAARLRRRFRGLQRADGGPSPAIGQHAGAYTLEAEPDSVDLHRYQRLIAQSRSLADSADDAQALALLQQAEALWRATPLSGLDGGWARQLRTALSARSQAATVDRIDIELRLGRFADVISELTALVERRPADEMLIGRLMTATTAADCTPTPSGGTSGCGADYAGNSVPSRDPPSAASTSSSCATRRSTR